MRMRNIMRMRLACQLLSGLRGAIHDPDLCIAFLETKDRGARRTSGSNHQNFRARQANALFEWTNYTSDIGVESVQFSVLRANDSVASSNFGAQSIRFVETLNDLLFQGHRDAQTLYGHIAGAFQQIIDVGGLEGYVNGINVLAPERGVHHFRR